MKYAELTRFGIPWEVCRMVEGPALGSPGPGEVNIKVEAGPINPAELLLIEGKYASRPPLPRKTWYIRRGYHYGGWRRS